MHGRLERCVCSRVRSLRRPGVSEHGVRALFGHCCSGLAGADRLEVDLDSLVELAQQRLLLARLHVAHDRGDDLCQQRADLAGLALDVRASLGDGLDRREVRRHQLESVLDGEVRADVEIGLPLGQQGLQLVEVALRRVHRARSLHDQVQQDHEVLVDVGDDLLEGPHEAVLLLGQRLEVGADGELFEQPAAVGHLARLFVLEQLEDQVELPGDVQVLAEGDLHQPGVDVVLSEESLRGEWWSLSTGWCPD